MGGSVVDKTDFVAFYQQLGLSPDCTLEELKTAYRRQVAQWHPDRRGRQTQPADAARLQELTARYNAASAFHRRYGRLPGASHQAIPVAMPQVRRPAVAAAADPPSRGRMRYWWWLVLGGGLLWAAWSSGLFDAGASATDPAMPTPARDDASVREPSAATALIEIGTDAARVRALEGRPLMESPQRWDYGPSWIGFHDGKVDDWYSSRLRPLKVASAHPPAARTASP